MADKKYTLDMCSGAILPKLLRLVLPLMLSSVLQLLFHAADIIVVGNFGSENSLAAVGSTGSLVNLMTNLFLGLSTGTNVLTARYMGARDHKNVSKVVHTAILLSIISGAVLTLVGVVFADGLLKLMQAPDEVRGLSATYLRIYFCGMIAMLIYNFGSSILRAKGDTKRPLYFLTLAGVINVVLNLVFVLGFRMDVAGVALATVISQCVSAALVLMCLMRETDAVKFEFRKMRIELMALKEILRVGIPAGLEGVVFSLSNVVLQSSINGFGPVVMAGSAAAASVEGFVWVAMNAFGQGTLTFTSQNVGGGKYSRINRIVLTCGICSCLTGLILGNLAYLFGGQLVTLYDPRPEIITPALTRMRFVCSLYFLCGIMDIMGTPSGAWATPHCQRWFPCWVPVGCGLCGCLPCFRSPGSTPSRFCLCPIRLHGSSRFWSTASVLQSCAENCRKRMCQRRLCSRANNVNSAENTVFRQNFYIF